MGEVAWPAGARVSDLRQVRGSRLHRKGGFADGACVRGTAHARRCPPAAAGLRLLRNSRGVRSAGAVHAQGVAVAGVLSRPARARAAARLDRSSQVERERRERCDRAPVCRNGRAHSRYLGKTARDPRQRTRADFDLYGGWDGCDGDRREVTERAADSIRDAAYCGPDTADRRPGGCKGRSSLQPAAGSKQRDPGEGAVTIADPDTAGNSTTNLTGEPED